MHAPQRLLHFYEIQFLVESWRGGSWKELRARIAYAPGGDPGGKDGKNRRRTGGRGRQVRSLEVTKVTSTRVHPCLMLRSHWCLQAVGKWIASDLLLQARNLSNIFIN